MTVQELNQSLQETLTTSDAIKDKIEDVAENKGISVDYGTDTPLSLLTKIDNMEVIESAIPSSLFDNLTVTWIFKIRVGDNKSLISAALSSSTLDFGVYLYDETINTYSQLYNYGNSWGYYYIKIGNNILLSSNSSNGLLLYNSELQTITELDNTTSGWRYFQIVGDTCLIGSSTADSGLLVYHNDTLACSKSIQTGVFNTFQPIGEDCLISGTSQSGLYLYDNSLNSVSLLVTPAYQLTDFQEINGDYLMSARNATNVGVYLYDGINKNATQIIPETDIGQWYIMTQVGNNCLIAASATANSGLYLYNGTTKIATKIYNSGYCWGNFPNQRRAIIQFSASQYLIGGYGGLLLYDNSVMSVTPIDTSFYRATPQFDVGDVCIIAANLSSAGGSQTITAVYIYEYATQQLTQLSSSFHQNATSSTTQQTVFIKMPNCVIIGAGDIGIYDIANKTFSQFNGGYSQGYYNEYEIIGDTDCYLHYQKYSNRVGNWRVELGNMTDIRTVNFIAHYNDTSKTVSIDKIYLYERY